MFIEDEHILLLYIHLYTNQNISYKLANIKQID